MRREKKKFCVMSSMALGPLSQSQSLFLFSREPEPQSRARALTGMANPLRGPQSPRGNGKGALVPQSPHGKWQNPYGDIRASEKGQSSTRPMAAPAGNTFWVRAISQTYRATSVSSMANPLDKGLFLGQSLKGHGNGAFAPQSIMTPPSNGRCLSQSHYQSHV
jgi:hypothetical protein